jgi:hypothetical protein
MACLKFERLLLKQLNRKTNSTCIPPAIQERIDRVNQVLDDYPDLVLSNRQVFYQFVRRSWCANEYNRYLDVNTAIRVGRCAGLLDWDRFEDRTRTTDTNDHWSGPSAILEDCVNWYAEDKWQTQARRVEVIVEKDALVGIVGSICAELDVPYTSARGFDSLSAQYQAARRIGTYNQPVVILYLGDHDPSGLECDESLRFKMPEFAPQANIEIRRLALTFDMCQDLPEWSRVAVKVGSIDPETGREIKGDPRVKKYIAEYGEVGWELDSLEPEELTTLIENAVAEYRDDTKWRAAVDAEEANRAKLRKAKLSR